MVFLLFLGPTGFFSLGGGRGPVINRFENTSFTMSSFQFLLFTASFLISTCGPPLEVVLPVSALIWIFYNVLRTRSITVPTETLFQVFFLILTFLTLSNGTFDGDRFFVRTATRRSLTRSQDYSVYSTVYFVILAILVFAQGFPVFFSRRLFYIHRAISQILPSNLRSFWDQVFGKFFD